MFAPFLEQSAAPRMRRRLILTGSVALHAALLALWAVHSFWKVDTLSAPPVAVTLVSGLRSTGSMPVPALPELQPRRPRRIPRPVAPVTVEPAPTLQPAAETASDSDTDAGEVDSVSEAPAAAGAPAGDYPPGPSILPIEVVRAQLAINPREDPYRPHLPRALNRPGARFFGVVIACVDATGIVESARVVQSAHPQLDPELLSKVKTWKFIPYQVGGQPTPFCFIWRCSMRSVWQGRAGG